MARYVKCYYCNQKFDRDKEPFVAVPDTARRYAHKECFDKTQGIENEEAQDKLKLELYIKKLFNVEYVPPLAQKQIKEYVADKGYTYSGILKTLMYHYEIKHGDISKAHNGIGIVPYTYENARQYFYSIWLAQQENQRIMETENFILEAPKVEIHITSPKRVVMGSKPKTPFSFLDEELQESEV